MKGAYYNENDPFAAAWLRELISDGRIAPGDVDDRSIEDVNPDDLDGYSQHHFFAGIGVWSLALRSAGWPDDRAIWTASCPCQPFSAAGKGGGFADERHLWPALHWLIGQCRPQHVIGEQVASKDGLAWLDLVFADLEAAEYAVGAVDTCAAGFGAPHIRQRSFWAARRLADTDDARSQGRGEPERERASQRTAGAGGVAFGMADAIDNGRGEHGYGLDRAPGESEGAARERQRLRFDIADDSATLWPGPTNGLWRAADWLGCTDGKWRPVESSPLALADDGTVRDILASGGRASDALTFPLCKAEEYRNRIGLLRGAGNAINLAQAQGFIEAVMEATR